MRKEEEERSSSFFFLSSLSSSSSSLLLLLPSSSSFFFFFFFFHHHSSISLHFIIIIIICVRACNPKPSVRWASATQQAIHQPADCNRNILSAEWPLWSQAGARNQHLPVRKALPQLPLPTRTGTRPFYLYPSTKMLLVFRRAYETGHVYTAACRFSGMNLHQRVV